MIPKNIFGLISELNHCHDFKNLSRAELYLSELFYVKCLHQEDDTIILEILSSSELSDISLDDILVLKEKILDLHLNQILPLNVKIVILSVLAPAASLDALRIANNILMENMDSLSLNDLHKILNSLELCFGLHVFDNTEASVLETFRLVASLEVKIDRLRQLVLGVLPK